METNSEKYWDDRFRTNWTTNKGMEQSAFFARIALGAFPEWLVKQISDQKLSICDWGCALGDGTNEIATAFLESKITGIDFSTVAIEKAKSHFPKINFTSQNLLTEVVDSKYDIFFSSNTLEHFANPWDVAANLSRFTNKHLVVLIPYKEYERYGEHMYSFDERNICSEIAGAFSLTHLEVIDGAGFTPSYWGALQVLLVYSKNDEILESGIKKITDVEIRLLENIRQQNELIKVTLKNKDGLIEHAQWLNATKDGELAQKDAALVQLEGEVAKKDLELVSLKALLLEKDKQITELKNEVITQQSVAEKYKVELEHVNQQLSAKIAADAAFEEKSKLHQQLFLQKDAEITALKNELIEADTRVSYLGKVEDKLAQKEQALNEATVSIEKNKFWQELVHQKEVTLEKSRIALAEATIQLQIKASKEKELEKQLAGEKELLKQKENFVDALKKEVERATVQAGVQLSQYKHLENALLTKEEQLKTQEQQLKKQQALTNDVYVLQENSKFLKTQLIEKEQAIEKLSQKLGEAQVQVGIKVLLEEKLSENEYLIRTLKKTLEEEKVSKAGLLDSLQGLQQYIGQLQRHLEWYNATFEKRSIWGIIKDKTVKPAIKK